MGHPDRTSAAPSRLAPLLDGAPIPLREVARTRLSVLYAVPDTDLPWVGVVTRDAVRLPHCLVTDRLPTTGGASLGDGALRVGGQVWPVTRWTRAARPRSLSAPALPEPLARARRLGITTGHVDGLGVDLPGPTYDGLRPERLLGAGPGLTPAGDDVLAGALVAAHATGDARLAAWSTAVRALLPAARRWYDGPAPSVTTAVSAAVLHDALHGWATRELADFIAALCARPGPDAGPLDRTHRRLLGLGHTSGAALAAGALHVISTAQLAGLEGAA